MNGDSNVGGAENGTDLTCGCIKNIFSHFFDRFSHSIKAHTDRILKSLPKNFLVMLKFI